MVVVKIIVIPFLQRLPGYKEPVRQIRIPAKLTRNVALARGRRDFVRVMLENSPLEKNPLELGPLRMLARPVLGKSGLIRTMIYADGLLEIGAHVEGLEKDTLVDIILL